MLLEHIDIALRLFFAAHGLALVIVNLTKTPKDNEALGKVYKLVEVIAGLVTPLAKR